VDAIFFTHSHADHVFGFDDIRRFNTIQHSSIPAYAMPETIADIRRVFDYIGGGDDTPAGLFRPKIEFRAVTGPFEFGDIKVTPVPVMHVTKPTAGYVLEAENRRIAYIPDCREMPEESFSCLRNLDVMILDGLRFKPHKTHLSIDDSTAILRRVGARQSFLIHMNHEVEHESAELEFAARGMPVHLSYDGLTLEL
jgi:phosphoribosyl 1,2-cyclic phosphate phosphodiesterase